MESKLIGLSGKLYKKLKLISCLTILLSTISCSYSRLYKTTHFKLLLSKNIWLKQTVSIEDEGFLAYNLRGHEAPPHSVILLYPQVIDPNLFLKERYINNSIINICPIRRFVIGRNKGVMKRYYSRTLTLESYCFNKNGWTILIEVANSPSKFKNIDELIYSFEILTPL